jgi:acetolactate synthase-1/2/3 large subunit
VLREAFELANTGRRGPVLVDVPSDVQKAVVEEGPLTPAPSPSPLRAPEADLRAAAEAINRAKRPFVYFGGGALASGASQEIIDLARKIGAPMGCSLMGISAIPTDTPGFLGMEGMHGHYGSTKAMYESDCLIALGARFNDRSTGDRTKYAPNGKVVHVDVDSSEFSKSLEDMVEVRSDVRTFLRDVDQYVEPNTHEDWQRHVRELRAQERGYADYREGLTPKNVMEAINAVRPEDVPVVTDVGQHQMWAAQFLRFTKPRTFVTSGGLGTMGFGMGAANGVALATGGPSILVTGDGSFEMDMAELITAADNRIPVIVVLLNNGVLGMVRQMQSLFKRQRYAMTTLRHRGLDFCAVARGMGAKATRVSTPEELGQALEDALLAQRDEKSAGPRLIEVPIDEDEFVTPVLQIGASMDELIVNMDDVRSRMGR